MMPRGGCIFWYTWIYLYKYDYVMDLNLMVMLHSTTSSYGRPVIEVAYGEMIFSLHRGCIGDDSSRRVVGMSTWCIAHVWHTRLNISVGSVYAWSLALSWPDEVQRKFSTAHELLNVKLIPQMSICFSLYKYFIIINYDILF